MISSPQPPEGVKRIPADHNRQASRPYSRLDRIGGRLLYWMAGAVLCRRARETIREFNDPATYFAYEVEKAADFDERFDFDLRDKAVLEIGCGFGGYGLHALSKGASFYHGIDISSLRIREARNLLASQTDATNFRLLEGDSRKLDTVESESVDLVVCDAVLEHIQGIELVFQEVARVLKSGGRAFFSTSPIWRTWNGGHIIRYMPVPWGHLIIPDGWIFRLLDLQRDAGQITGEAYDNIAFLYRTIGKLTVPKVKDGLSGTGLELRRLENFSTSRLKRMLIPLPWLGEFFSGDIRLTLERARSSTSRQPPHAR
jgi:SAM-dependent methyltransferase